MTGRRRTIALVAMREISERMRGRAFKLSTTLFSCPEYVWMKNHCFIMENP